METQTLHDNIENISEPAYSEILNEYHTNIPYLLEHKLIKHNL